MWAFVVFVCEEEFIFELFCRRVELLLQVVAPKQAKLAAANAEFSQLQVQLALKKEMLAGVQAKLAKLQEQLEDMNRKKMMLEAEVENCQKVSLRCVPSKESITIHAKSKV
jgi:chromosome segregation ATPase